MGVREIVKVAQAMHQCMVSLNEERETVLEQARQGGWLAYRPTEGGLVRADSQLWARQHPDSSHRMDSQTRRNRYAFVKAGKPVADKADLLALSRPEVQESTYLWEGAGVLLECDQQELGVSAQQLLQYHPSERRQAVLHELTKTTSQRQRKADKKRSKQAPLGTTYMCI